MPSNVFLSFRHIFLILKTLLSQKNLNISVYMDIPLMKSPCTKSYSLVGSNKDREQQISPIFFFI